MCDELGHYLKNCPKLQDAKNAVKSETHIAYGHNTIIDSGASQHMFKNVDAFDDDMLPINTNISCANAQEIEATHVGFVNMHCDDSVLHLKDVLHVPKLKHNLVSVRALNKDGNDVMFHHDGSVVLTNNDSSQIIGHAVGNLYYMTSDEFLAGLTTNVEDQYTIWHYCLGHPGTKVLQTISAYIRGINNLTPNSSKPCPGCVYAKSHRLPFSKNAENRADEILGPMPTPSIQGSQYILTFIDDASRFTKVYFLKYKSETFKTFCEYRALVEKKMSRQIKTLRSDGGGEYINQEMRDYFTLNGI